MYKYDYDNRVEECSLFYPSDDISQGTIIKFENRPEDETYAIIVTGDCDIAQRKFGKYLSFCYILSLKTYVSDFLIQKLCIKKIERNKQCIFKRLRQIAGFERTSDDALESFVLYDEENLNSLLSDKSLIRDILTIQSFIQKEVFSLSDYKQLTKAKTKDLIDAIRSFPGDKFYINSIPAATLQNKGFVVN